MATARRRTSTKRSAPVAAQGDPTTDALVLTGPPGRLGATVTVHNAGDRRLSVRGGSVTSDAVSPQHARLGGTVAAGRTRDVPVSVQVGAATPPGSYPAALEVGGVSRAATLRVEPDLDVRVSPRRLLATRGEQSVQLRITNAGNVPVPLARLVRGSARADGVIGDLDVELHLQRPVTVEPGLAVDATGRVVVPDGLDPTRRHEARLPVGTADLVVVVLPTDDRSDTISQPETPLTTEEAP